MAAAGTVCAMGCGCETKTTDAGICLAWSWCAEHGGNRGPAGLYSCGECGFRSRSFDRVERHVYGEHLGVRVA